LSKSIQKSQIGNQQLKAKQIIDNSKAERLSKIAFDYYYKGNLKDALNDALQSITINQFDDNSQILVATIYQETGRYDEAIPYFEKAIKLSPNNTQYRHNFSLVLKTLHRYNEALVQLNFALKNEPDNTACINEAGLNYIELGDHQNAQKFLSRSHDLDPENKRTLVYLSYHCIKTKLLNEAISFAEQALKLDSEFGEAYFHIGQALTLANFIEKGIEYIHISLTKSDINACEKHRSTLMPYLYSDQYSNETIFEAHRQWANKYLNYKSFEKRDKNEPAKKLKIGFVSSNFNTHSVSHFILPIFQHYNRDNFEYYCYSGTPKLDEVSESIQHNTDVWRQIYNLSDEEIINTIKQDNIDILIDLAGHSASPNHIGIFSQKPAPLLMSYLGYPFSTGLENIDYRIVDEYTDPIGLTEHLHTETLIRIKNSFLCFQPPKQNITIEKNPPLNKNNHITFGSFNNLNKLSGTTIELWSIILKTVPNSKLALKSSQSLPSLLKEHIIAQFQTHEISIDRLIILNYDTQQNEHLEKYNKIDICLDTYPYNGTTTTFEALWMGVPVITLSGNAHLSRVGNSILQNMELSELIANSPEEYLNIAVALSKNKDKIQNYRHSLRDKLMSSDLTNEMSFSKKIDELLRNSWCQYCESKN